MSKNGDSGRQWTDGDFTGEGLVNYDDFLMLYHHFAMGSRSAAPTASKRSALAAFATSHVPEPAGLALGAIVALISCRSR